MVRIYVQCFDGGYGNHFIDMKFVCLCEQRFEVFCFQSEKDTISINIKSMIFHEIKFLLCFRTYTIWYHNYFFILTMLNSIFFNFYCRFITFINWIRLSISLIRMYWFNDSLLFSDQCTSELSAVTETLASCQVSHHIHGLPLLLLPDGHGSSGCGGHYVRHSPTYTVLW